MENSIEEYIKILEKFSNENVIYGSTVGMTLEKYKDLQLSAEHILSEYKRVLKENEELISDNLEYQRIQDRFDKRTYRKKYLEERRKEEPNLLYPDADEIYRRYYELQKENQQLRKEINRENKKCMVTTEEIEDIIAEIKAEKLNYSKNEYYLENEIKGYAIDKLKELLESEE